MCLTAQEKCALIERKLHIEKSCIRAGDFGDQRTCCLVRSPIIFHFTSCQIVSSLFKRTQRAISLGGRFMAGGLS